MSLTPDDPGSLARPTAIGPFRVLHQVGAGVLGPVFRAHSADTDSEVAVKLFRLDLTPEQGRDLASALGRLCARLPDHPHIVAGRVTGVLGATAWMASAFVAADALDTRLRRRSLVGLTHALPLLRQVATALDAAAALGIHHAALHPRDVLVTTTGRVYVTGFGVSGALIATGLTPPARRPYAPPERLATPALAPDAAGDVFSLGALAVEMLTGRRASGTGASAVGFVSGVGEGIDADVCRRALGRALAESPEDRFSSAGAFVAALSHALSEADVAEADGEDRETEREEGEGDGTREAAGVREGGHEDEAGKGAARPALEPTVPSLSAPRPARPLSRPRRSPEPRAAAGAATPPPVVEPPAPPPVVEAESVSEPVGGPEAPPAGVPEPPVPAGRAEEPAPTEVDLFGMTALDAGTGEASGTGDEAGELPLEPLDAPAPAVPDWRRDLEARVSARRAAAGRAAGGGAVARRPFRDVPIRGVTGVPGETPDAGGAGDAEEAVAGELDLDSPAAETAAEPWQAAPAPALDGRLKRGEAFAPVGARVETVSAGRPRPTAAEGARLLAAMFLGIALGLLAGYGFWGPGEGIRRVPGMTAAPTPGTVAEGVRAPEGTTAPTGVQGPTATSATSGDEVLRGPERTAAPAPTGGGNPATAPVRTPATAPVQAPPTVQVTTPARAPAKPPAKPTPVAPPVKATRAILEVVSRPAGARVILDGRPAGTTPVRALEAAPGTHTVRLELAGYAPWTASIRVAGGERTRVAASLELLTTR